ncbi:MAG: hypothetical protein QM493_12115 [Sulfurovum sp.]
MINKIFLSVLLLSSLVYSSQSKEERLEALKKELNIGQPIIKEEKLSDKKVNKIYIVDIKDTVEIIKTKKESKVEKKETLSDSERLAKIKAELGIKELTPREKKLADIKRELNIGYELPQKDNSFNNAFKELKKEIDIDKIKDSLSLDGDIGDISLDSIKISLEIEDGEYFGLPSIFGLNKKIVPDTILGSTILANLKDTGDNMYKGFRYSGSSAETLSGLMYYNSKAYNSMFSIFDESSLSIFESEDKKEKSIFDVFD